MSVQALSCAMVFRGVTASEKLLLLVLANYADEHMTCWPSHKRMAADACLSERTILTLLKGLEGKLFISRRERFRSDGSRTTDAITLHFSGEVTSPHTAKDAEGVGKSTAPGGAEISPLTTFDPSFEPSKKEPVEAATSAAPPNRRLRLVPQSWSPTAKVLSDLAVTGFTPGEIERELANFRDHEFRDPKSDFDRAFRRWMRNSRTFQTGPRHERPHTDAKLAAKQANYARAWEGSERAARFRGEP